MEQIKSMLILSKILEHGSMSKVARELGISASAVSQHLKQLEQFYNLKLLNRTTRQISPTSAGKVIWDGARQILANLNDIDKKLEQLKTEIYGNVGPCK